MEPQKCRITCCPASIKAAQGESASLPDEPSRRKGDNKKETMSLPPRPTTDHDRDVIATRNWFSRRHEGDKPAKIVAKFIAADQRPAAVSEVAGRLDGIASRNKAKRARLRTPGQRSAIA